MLNAFRLVALLEGISYLALFAFSMPLKYWGELPVYNIFVGYAHGALFILYILLAFVLFVEQKWSVKFLIKVLLASVLPFGTFYMEQRYFRVGSGGQETANS